ncbi:MAG: hypothetical protein M3N98_08940 [Actinomycetota bacterium]|nr:hypothetical protein [Actinomycetota bacterium]
MESSLSRRTFLLGAVTLAGAAACSKGHGVIKVGGPNAAQQLNLLEVSGPDFYSGVNLRLAFGLSGQPAITNPAPGSVTLQFGTDEKRWGPAVPADIHTDAGDAPAYLTTTYRFPNAGTYWVRAGYQGKTADAPLTISDPSAIQSPIPGRPMPSLPTPTLSDHRGVEPICTRSPICPLHNLSLDTALTKSLPVALLFATPLLCETRFCGPVLDTLLQASSPFGGKVQFIHSEIFTEPSRAAANTPAVLAYHLQSEPVLILADAHGVVTERIDGLFGLGEVTAALSRLAAS